MRVQQTRLIIVLVGLGGNGSASPDECDQRDDQPFSFWFCCGEIISTYTLSLWLLRLTRPPVTVLTGSSDLRAPGRKEGRPINAERARVGQRGAIENGCSTRVDARQCQCMGEAKEEGST